MLWFNHPRVQLAKKNWIVDMTNGYITGHDGEMVHFTLWILKS